MKYRCSYIIRTGCQYDLYHDPSSKMFYVIRSDEYGSYHQYAYIYRNILKTYRHLYLRHEDFVDESPKVKNIKILTSLIKNTNSFSHNFVNSYIECLVLNKLINDL